jgi:hypothetical protein
MKKLIGIASALILTGSLLGTLNAAPKKFKCRQANNNCACYNNKSSDECRKIYKNVASCVPTTESLPECKK